MNIPPLLRRIGFISQRFGIDPLQFVAGISSIIPFLVRYLNAVKNRTSAWPIKFMPALGDRGESAGSTKGHYFYMDLWAARRVFKEGYIKVVDVGSRIDGYVAHVLSFRDIEVFDVRPIATDVPGMTFIQADLMNSAGLPINYSDCVTCLHALEHFGLGRYGDPIDDKGWAKGLESLTKILSSGGSLLLAVPVGKQRIEFDAHRVFSPITILDESRALGLKLSNFSYVNDDGKFIENGELNDAKDLIYGCGCFEFKKI